MKIYKVKVEGYCPAPRSREYNIKASGASVAASRAIKKYRNEDEFKGKHIKRFIIKIQSD